MHNFLFKKRKKIFKLFFNFVVIREILVYNSTVNKTNKRLQNKQAKVCNLWGRATITKALRKRNENMNSKRVLRFYFAADKLNEAMDNLIERFAIASREEYALCKNTSSKICSIIDEKNELAVLWGYLNGIMQLFNENDRELLRGYALRRTGISKLAPEVKRNIRRVLVKFTRKAECRIERYAEGIRLVDAYYCLCG